MARVKSENWYGGASVGIYNRWVHIDAGSNARVTITPATNKPLVLRSVTINNSSSGGNTAAIVLTDSGRGIIANSRAGIAEKDYHYDILLTGSLVIDPTTIDATIVYLRD